MKITPAPQQLQPQQLQPQQPPPQQAPPQQAPPQRVSPQRAPQQSSVVIFATKTLIQTPQTQKMKVVVHKLEILLGVLLKKPVTMEEKWKVLAIQLAAGHFQMYANALKDASGAVVDATKKMTFISLVLANVLRQLQLLISVFLKTAKSNAEASQPHPLYVRQIFAVFQTLLVLHHPHQLQQQQPQQ